MTRRQLLISIIALAGYSMSGCAYAPAADTMPRDLAAYQWLLGDWRADAGKQFVHETWQVNDERSFAGIGSMENRETGARRVSERIELVARDGKVFYIPTVPHNPAPVVFELVSDDPHVLVFTNPEHDFPKKIVYRRIDRDHFRAEVSDGGSKGFVQEFKRMTGESPGATKDN